MNPDDHKPKYPRGLVRRANKECSNYDIEFEVRDADVAVCGVCMADLPISPIRTTDA